MNLSISEEGRRRPRPLSAQHLPGLDGLRGVAILLVMMIHLGVMIPATAAESGVFTIISMGWVGVELFFVLSGFLITGILLDSKGSERYFRNFYIKRVLRIFPLYYAILIFSFYILPHFAHPKLANFSRIDGYEAYYWFFLSNISMAIQGGPKHAIMDISWSLAIEEQFYLVWPLLVFLCGLRRLAIVCAGLIVFTFGFRVLLQVLGFAPWTLYVVTPARLDGLCAGALIAIAVRWPGLSDANLGKTGRWLALAGGGATAVIAILSGGLPWDGVLVQSLGFTTLAASFAGLLLLTVLQSGRGTLLDRMMSARFTMAFGVLAYGIYLTHLPLRALIRDTIMRPGSYPDFPGGTLAAQLAFYLLAGALAYAVAWISFHFYERRFLRLKPILARASAPAVPAVRTGAPI